MIRRHTEAGLLNEIANDPEVRPWIGNPELGPLDLSSVAGDERNYVLLDENGGFVAIFLGEGIYECHALFRKDGRGSAALQTAREAAEYMFCRTPCVEILTRIPDGHFGTKMLSTAIGFRLIFLAGREEFMGGERLVHAYRLGLDDWAQRADLDYPEIARRMLAGGLPQKALVWYNRYAVMCRKPLAHLVRYPGSDQLQIERLENSAP